MTYEFDADAKRLIGHFESEGYKMDSSTLDTVHVMDSKGKAVYAYMEPCAAELSRENVKVILEFYPKHEREAKKKKIKSLSIRPSTLQLHDILKSEKSLAEIFSAGL